MARERSLFVAVQRRANETVQYILLSADTSLGYVRMKGLGLIVAGRMDQAVSDFTPGYKSGVVGVVHYWCVYKVYMNSMQSADGL